MGAILALAALFGLLTFGGGKGSSVTPPPTPKPDDELGERWGTLKVTDTAVSPTATFEVFLNAISAGKFAWYAYKNGTRIGSGAENDDDQLMHVAWDFLISQISSGATIELTLDTPKGKASGTVGPQGAATIENWRWSASTGNESQSAVENTRGLAFMAMADWIEGHLAGKQGVSQPQPGARSGNGITVDDSCNTIFLTAFPAFLAYAKPRIEQAFAGNKPPTAATLATLTIGPAAGVNTSHVAGKRGCPLPTTLVNGMAWSEIEPVVKDTIAAVVKPDWLSVAEPTVVLAHLLVNTKPNEPGVVENYHDHAIVVRPRAVGGGFEALVFSGPARTLDADAEVLAIPGADLAQMLTRARQRVNAIDGGVITQGTNQVPVPHFYKPPKNAPGKLSKDWTCAAVGYNPAAQNHQIPQIGWAARKTAEIELFKIDGKWANCSSYDVRVGVCLRTGYADKIGGQTPYGELATMLATRWSADMSKVPVFEPQGVGALDQSDSWVPPPAFKVGIRVAIRLQGGKWTLQGAAQSISATEASINACPGTKHQWPLPQTADWFNIIGEGGSYEKWYPKVTTEIFLSGNRVMLRIGYAGIPQFKKFGSKYRALYAATPLYLSTRVDARGEP